MARKIDEIISIANSPKGRAFLDFISRAEGTDPLSLRGMDGYRVIVGAKDYAPDFNDHPAIYKKYKNLNTSAAGRYQITKGTWDDLKKRYPDLIQDFSPMSQDLAAIALADERGILDRWLEDDLDGLIKKGAPTWAALGKQKDERLSQPFRSREWLKNVMDEVNLSQGEVTGNPYETLQKAASQAEDAMLEPPGPISYPKPKGYTQEQLDGFDADVARNRRLIAQELALSRLPNSNSAPYVEGSLPPAVSNLISKMVEKNG